MTPAATSPPAGSPSSLFGAKRALARATGSLSRRAGRGGGTTLPGRMLLRMAPDAIERLGDRLQQGSTVISATNGKTTTAGMLAAILGQEDRFPVHNRAGSNMHWGVATALLEQEGAEGLFEVDEAWLGTVTDALAPRLMVLSNLFRDQLDRYGELERLASGWEQIVERMSPPAGLVLNADDPRIAELGLAAGGEVSYFGIDDPSVALTEVQHAHDARFSRRTGAAYVYEHSFVGHLGAWSCPGEGRERPARDVSARRVRLDGMAGSRLTVATPQGELEMRLPVPGLYNVHNALAAIAAAGRLGASGESIVRGLESMSAIFGRVEQLTVHGQDVAILLIKNPTGANEVLRTVKLESVGPDLDLWIALNDHIADGRDVSWVWDADFELLAGSVRRVTCAGTRSAELAVRLKYAGIPTEAISVQSAIADSFDAALAEAPGRLIALPTYTALLELRTLLADAGHAEEYWA
ncbi:MAG: MurT ligase domain-containing protein [Solirubrobacterales bacterium]